MTEEENKPTNDQLELEIEILRSDIKKIESKKTNDQLANHLSIQDVIKRMAYEALYGKCFCFIIVLFAAIFASNTALPYFETFVFLFWIYSAYFLMIERLLRDKYTDLSQLYKDPIKLSFDKRTLIGKWLTACFSPPIWIFYLSMLLFLVFITYL